MTRPWPLHAHARKLFARAHDQLRLPLSTLAGSFLVLAAMVVTTAAPQPAADGPRLERVAYASMSNATLSDRAEWDPDYARALGHRMIRDFGWRSDRKWRCLRKLWNFESSRRVD